MEGKPDANWRKGGVVEPQEKTPKARIQSDYVYIGDCKHLWRQIGCCVR